MFGNTPLIVGGGNVVYKKITAPSGRILYRHSSGMGTVMEFNDGIARKVLVLDAVHRSPVTLQFGTNDLDTSLTNHTSCPYGGYYIYLTSNSGNITAAASVTDTYINTYVVKDTKTAKQNCDILMSYVSTNDGYCTGVPAVQYCRSKLVNGTPCDLPNIQTLARIYCDGLALDAMDPLLSTNLTRALGTQNTQGAWYISANSGPYPNKNYSWSSTECNKLSCWSVRNDGYIGYGSKYGGFSIIPVLEL